ncbi:hypothetical protein RO3G_05358 [Rhizopus delemar RA 99-880]|uniref:Uncharacterized protein n=1 Tax=Rhizopus delemar (strain RA 99-880 / ATCC MYA-4621 / FGSC 9543 / NRRL 43880) TaxID=246409 RepID=I1BWS3_RHIO9|nr:hypothetical protein RO3G_05358 [Rhizopus delemar RA 99-880]|eukprot:EIE80653.1 hypothetical protein RO3G_05358 [Rhizopus delemar RA 99-880]
MSCSHNYSRKEVPKICWGYIINTDKVCLVALDYAGLSTDCNDLYGSLIQHPNLKKIIIDNIPSNNIIHAYDRNELLNKPETLKKFYLYSSLIYWLACRYIHSFQNLSQKQDIDGA